MPVTLTNPLRAEYRSLFDACEIRPARRAAVETIVSSVIAQKARYEAVGDPLGIPWYFIAAIHNLESSLRFNRHLHNGDPLTARTTHVPPGRPLTGEPPFTWEQSATDALLLQRLDRVTDWTLPSLLFQWEKYNGMGYRNRTPPVPSPYLWSFSNQYSKGKFIADGTYDAEAVSQQCGAAVLLRRLAELQLVTFDQPIAPLVTFSLTESSEAARQLQRFLNTQPGIFLQVDGVPGPRTSDALHLAFGHFLRGDPRMLP